MKNAGQLARCGAVRFPRQLKQTAPSDSVLWIEPEWLGLQAPAGAT